MSCVRAMAMNCLTRMASDRPFPTVSAVVSASRMRWCQSTTFMRGFTHWSSLPNSAAMRPALLEQPASFKRIA